MVVLKETHFVTPHHLTEILNEGQTTAIEQNRMRGGLSTKEDRKVGAHPGGTITSTNRNHLGESYQPQQQYIEPQQQYVEPREYSRFPERPDNQYNTSYPEDRFHQNYYRY